MQKEKQSLWQNKPALFDWSVVVLSTLLGLFFPSLGDFAGTTGFSFWMLGALVLYTAGALLKDLPLSRRLSSPATPPRQVPFLLFLLIGHWILLLTVTILSENAFRALAGMPPLPANYSAEATSVIFYILVPLFITWLVFRTKSNRRKRRVYPAGFLVKIEWVADILLFLSVSVFTFLFWEKGALAMLKSRQTVTVGDVWFLFIFLAILYVLVFLPLRYLYFIEDRSSYGKRLRYLFGFLLLRVLFEMISF